MEEQEVDVEHLHEMIHENSKKAAWAEKVALTTALLAVLAAVSNLFSAHESDNAVLKQIRASDQWSLYQAKSIKSKIVTDAAEKARYETEQEEVKKKAEELETGSEHSLNTHEFFSYAVTLFQVATGMGAIAVLVKKKWFWYTSMALGGFGVAMAIKALMMLK
jgi:hypothetical protein